MQRRLLLAGMLVAGSLGWAGCQEQMTPTVTEPQAENQRAKTPEERIDYLIAMLHRKDSPKKNAQAARALGKIGADAARALPDLEQVAAEHDDPDVRVDAEMAALAIQSAETSTP